MPNPRGAPPGNRNALKHGFYARQFKTLEIKDLEAYSFTGLKEEISALRICLRRAMETYQTLEDPQDSMNLLRVICHLSTSLTRMIRTQALLLPPKDDIHLAFEEAIAAVQREMESAMPSEPEPDPPAFESN